MEDVNIHDHENRIANNSIKIGELEGNLSKCGVKWDFQLAELYDFYETLKEELKDLFKTTIQEKMWFLLEEIRKKNS